MQQKLEDDEVDREQEKGPTHQRDDECRDHQRRVKGDEVTERPGEIVDRSGGRWRQRSRWWRSCRRVGRWSLPAWRPRCHVSHRDADVCGAEGRGVVDAVTGHRHDFALASQRFDQPVLVVGAGPGEHVRRCGECVELFGRRRGRGRRPWRSWSPPRPSWGRPQPFGHRVSSGGVIAGDHDHPDARAAALRPGPRRRPRGSGR